MAVVSDPPRPDPQQGIFETLLVVDGRPVELAAHLARLADSLAELFPSSTLPPGEPDVPGVCGPYGGLSPGTSGGDGVVGVLRIAVAPSGEGGLRARVERCEAPAGAFVPASGEKTPAESVALGSFGLAGGLGAHKWVDRSLLDAVQTDLPADTLPLIVDRGAMLEASRANLFAVRDGTLSTPPTDGRILPGITRARVMKIAAAAGIEIQEAAISREDLLGADEVFLTGSVRGVERVRALDDTELAGRGEIGSRITAELRRTWGNGRFG